MSIRKIVLAVVFVLLFAVVGCAQGPSFDCSKAGTKVEKIICGNSELSKLDDDLSKAYTDALTRYPDHKANYYHLQRAWLKERNKCDSVDCLRDKYQQRITQLTPTAPSKASNSGNSQCLEPKIDWRDYDWVLISGKDQPACQDMLAYLKSRPSNAPPPVCPEDRLPPGQDWTRPEGRDLIDAERQILLGGLPDSLREKAQGQASIEWQFKNAKLLRVLHTDISRDGIPEYLLAYATHDYRQECKAATQCAVGVEGVSKGGIRISVGDSFYYSMQPLNAKGVQVNWTRRPTGYPSMLMGGELVHYKGKPYWLSYPEWSQKVDGRTQSFRPITWPYAAMFKLNEIGVASLDGENKAPHFKNVTAIVIEHDPQSLNVCRFGYINRERIKYSRTNGGE